MTLVDLFACCVLEAQNCLIHEMRMAVTVKKLKTLIELECVFLSTDYF